MKLTKAQRTDFVKAVMADLPRTAMKARRAAINKFKDDCLNRLPSDVLKVYKKYPKMFNAEQFQLQGFGVLWNEREISPDSSNWVYVPVIDTGKLPLEPDYSTQKPYKDECWAAHKLELRINDVVSQCMTLSDLKFAFPEFEKYMPKVQEEVVRNLPVAAGGLVADICKFGHPICANTQEVRK
jgi:hypothetical protein